MNLTVINWFNTQKNGWITDYIHIDSDDMPCIVSTILTEQYGLPTYQFVIHRTMSDKLYENLEDMIDLMNNHNGLFIPEFRLINIQMSCNGEFVAGTFEMLLDQEDS